MNSLRQQLGAELSAIATKTETVRSEQRAIEKADEEGKSLIASLSPVQIAEAVSEIESEMEIKEAEIQRLQDEFSSTLKKPLDFIRANCPHRKTEGNQWTRTCSACGKFLGEHLPTSLIYDQMWEKQHRM